MQSSRLLLVSASLLNIALLAGCGGGGGGGGGSRGATPTPAAPAQATTGTVRLRVAWPAREGRALPGAAESARVVLMQNGAPVETRLIVRDPNQPTNAYTDQVVFSGLPIAGYQLVVTAYPSADGSGVVLTQGTIEFPLSAGQPERVAEITPGATVKSAVERLTINATRVPVGQNVTLTATAFNAANEAVPVRAESLRWSVEPGRGVSVTESGTLFSPNVASAAVTVTDPDSGKSHTQTIQCGFGTQLTVATSGAGGAIPFFVSPWDDTISAQTDVDGQMQSVQNVAGDGQSVVFQWLTNGSVTSGATPITVTAPATYGDRQFVKWQQGGADVSASPTMTLDPRTVSSSSLVAVYTPRAAEAEGFLPNHLHDHDIAAGGKENRTVRWNPAKNKITFIRTGQFNEDAKNRAVQGFKLWQKSVGGRYGSEIIGDDQADQADIVVIFADKTNIAPLPSAYIPGYTLGEVSSGYAGLTAYNFVTGANGQRYGVGKRVIYLFTQSEGLPSIAAHELGHAIGFVGHSENRGDIMYPTVTVRHLSERDVNAYLTVQTQAEGDTGTRAVSRAAGRVESTQLP